MIDQTSLMWQLSSFNANILFSAPNYTAKEGEAGEIQNCANFEHP